ncbi:hypothetical protein NECAME_10672 [Necator americanus]|uniref:Uncharacterized protein n=1 Tax=Necator americanus TaxID=51031 RepID=W2T9T2_NECAM|nr:hypothetical protein NECAME_10672 [Necator americanus]ETN77971.1 hypothetical protein NECAME_10672 [Necator americanus]
MLTNTNQGDSEFQKPFSGRIRHYIIRVNEKRETEKDEVEPARVLFNIIKPPRLKCHVDKRFKEGKWIPTPLEDPKFVDWDEVIDCSPALEERLTDLQISAATRRANLTLGDFISDKPPSIRSRRAESLNFTSDTDDSFEFVTMKPAKLCDISKYTNAPHIFEIFDINMKDLGNFDLQEEATRCNERDQLEFVRPFYSQDGVEFDKSVLSGSAQSSSIDLLYAVLPLPVMSLIVKKSYLHHFRLMYPQSRLLQCPQCSISLVIKKLSGSFIDFWLIVASGQCEEISDLFEKFNLDVGERLLCIKCCCEGIFYAAENSAHGTLCSNFNKKCWRQYDKDGLMRPKFDLYWPYTPRFRKEFHKPDEDEFFKNGTRVHPEYLEPKKLVKKEFAAICAEARSLRFDEKKQRNFEEEVCKIFDDEAMQQRAIGIRKTALTLVENCTALLYLHRAENNQHLKRKDFNAHFANLDKELSDVIISFRHYLVQEQPQVLL